MQNQLHNLYFMLGKPNFFRRARMNTDLSISSRIELFISEKCIQLIRSLHVMIFGLKLRSKTLEQSSVIPCWHGVIGGFHPVNETLDRVAIVVQKEAMILATVYNFFRKGRKLTL